MNGGEVESCRLMPRCMVVVAAWKNGTYDVLVWTVLHAAVH